MTADGVAKSGGQAIEILEFLMKICTFARSSDCRPDAVNVVTLAEDALSLQSSTGVAVPAHCLYHVCVSVDIHIEHPSFTSI